MFNTCKHVVGLHKIAFNVDIEAMSLMYFNHLQKAPVSVRGTSDDVAVPCSERTALLFIISTMS